MDTSEFVRPVVVDDGWAGDTDGDFVFGESQEPACALPALGTIVRVLICAGAIVLSAVAGWLIGRLG